MKSSFTRSRDKTRRTTVKKENLKKVTLQITSQLNERAFGDKDLELSPHLRLRAKEGMRRRSAFHESCVRYRRKDEKEGSHNSYSLNP